MRQKPLVYSCSGCSSAAQMANYLAIRMDRLGIAEMSCIAGVGGDVPSLVRVARSGRPIVALDGCALECVAATLRRHDLTADRHIVLSKFGIRKRKHADFDVTEADLLLGVVRSVTESLADDTPAEGSDAGCPPAMSAAQDSASPTQHL